MRKVRCSAIVCSVLVALAGACNRQAQEPGSPSVVSAAAEPTALETVEKAAGDWVKVVAPVVGGAGGGKPTLAQAGGKLPQKLPEALQAAATYVQEKLA